jgi:hypothetical protein
MNSDTKPETPAAPAAPPAPQAPGTPDLAPKGGLFADPAAALSDVRDYYKGWTGRLTDQSFQLSMALIAANWAVFGSLNHILGNLYSKLSIAVVVGGLWIGLLATWRMSEALRKRIDYAEADPAEWAKEFEKYRGRSVPWPFTEGIDQLGIWLRRIKTFTPIAGGILFFLALALG